MAKGVEDTAFYRLQPPRVAERGRRRSAQLRLLPPRPSTASSSDRAGRWPHDHARDLHPRHQARRGRARAHRRAVASSRREWRRRVRRWRALNRSRRQEVDGRRRRPANDEYLLYQTLLGAWPLETAAAEARPRATFASASSPTCSRLRGRPSCTPAGPRPIEAYEDGADAVRRARSWTRVSGRAFIADLRRSRDRIARFGALNGLAQTLLKLTVAGRARTSTRAPSSGTCSLVDPDNRRPVDYDLRGRWLAEPRPASELVQAGGAAGSSST